jgi:putative transposase
MRAYPTHGQQVAATRMLRVHCDIYNACLEERIKAWKMNQVTVSYKMQSAQLSAVRKVDPRCGEFSFSAEQRTVKRVERAFQAFFRRVKAGDTPGFPRFKPHQRFNTVDHTAGDGSRWTPTQGRWARAYFQGVGHIKVSEHTRVEGTVKQLSLVRDGRRWYVIAVAANEPEHLPETGRSVGVDVGINRFLTTSDGEIVPNPRFAAEAAVELAELQRRLAALGGRSKNLRRQIAKLHRKTKNQRLNFHHQTARELVNTYDVIAIEDLQVRNMSRKAKPKPDPDNPGTWLPNGAAAKTGLNRSIADVGWAQFRTILTAKAENAGRSVIAVNPANTSINCHRCGTRCTRPTTPTVICPNCGPIDADINGAHNISTRAGTGSHLRPAA